MIKKALIRTCIFEYIDANNINDPQTLMDSLPQIFEQLKDHEHHGNLIPPDMKFEDFAQCAVNGYTAANVHARFMYF